MAGSDTDISSKDIIEGALRSLIKMVMNQHCEGKFSPLLQKPSPLHPIIVTKDKGNEND